MPEDRLAARNQPGNDADRGAVTEAAPAAAGWPAEREALQSLAAAGLTGAQIAKRYGVTRSAAMGRLGRLGVKLTKKPPPPGRPKGWKRPPVAANHASHRSRRRGERAYTDAEIATAIAAHLAGLSRKKAAAMIGASAQSMTRSWLPRPDLMAQGRELYETARADAAARASAAKARRDMAAALEALRVAAINAPILARMPSRHRAMCEGRVAGETLQVIGDRFGVTRERVRQIEAKWRAEGLIVPGAKPLSEASRKMVYRPTARKPGRRRGGMSAVEFYAAAADVAASLEGRPRPARKPYTMSEAERARRVAHGHWLAQLRHGGAARHEPAFLASIEAAGAIGDRSRQADPDELPQEIEARRVAALSTYQADVRAALIRQGVESLRATGIARLARPQP